jgi:DNA-binding CsgD family transcriptional regulator
VDPPSLAVEVSATEALRERVVAALEASGIGLHEDGDGSTAEVRIVAEDLLRHVAVSPLRARLGVDRDAPVLVVSPECTPLAARRAIRAGASAVIVASDLEETLAPAVRAVAAGLSALPVPVRNAAYRPALSYREREVLRRATAGETNSEIAEGMFLAQSTVKSHLSSAYRKLGVGGRKEAASLILDPDGGLLDVVFGTRARNRPSPGASPTALRS